MAFMDLIQELRTGRPNRRKAARVLQGLGLSAVVVGLLNVTMGQLPGAPIRLGPLTGTVFVLLVLDGVLLTIAGRALARAARWSVPLAQWTLALALVFFSVGLIDCFHQALGEQAARFAGGPDRPPVAFRVITTVGVTLVVLQFVVPVWFGIRYLGRLRDETASGNEAGEMEPEVARSQDRKRRYAVLPLPMLVIFTLYILLGMLLFVGIGLGAESQSRVVGIVPAILVFILLPVAYNLLPSRFERSRRPILTSTGGGSLYLLQGSWPFFRLLVYDDGVEVRLIFQRFFVPYAEAEEISLDRAGIVIRSNLPGVPSLIRFLGPSYKKAYAVMESHMTPRSA